MGSDDAGVDSLSMALVHEWLSLRAGSEKTFEQMAASFPSADLYALSMDNEVVFDLDRPVQTSMIQRSRFLSARRQLSLPLMPLAWKALRTTTYDVVVTSSHAFCRYFPTSSGVHLSYVYTPIRYAWLPEVDGRGNSRVFAPARGVLRQLDRRSTRDVHSFAAISTVVAHRINEFYGREARVVFPPVDVEFFRGGQSVARQDFVLGVSRWIPYKRLDLVIEAAERVGLPAVIAGDGPLEPELRARAERARVPVRIVRSPSDLELRQLYRQAAVVVFPAEEDFGIVPVEAQAAGAPVVALRRGGSLDTVADGVSGFLVEDQDPSLLASGVERALNLNLSDARAHVDQFSISSFRTSFRSWVGAAVGGSACDAGPSHPSEC